MKIALSADWHIRGKDFDAVMAQILLMAQEINRRRIRLLLVAGDVFDSPMIGDRFKSTGEIVSTLTTIFQQEAPDVVIVCVAGNHDRRGPCLYSAASVLNGVYGQWRVFDVPRVYRFEKQDEIGDGEETLDIYALPWVYGSEKSAIETLRSLPHVGNPADRPSENILLAHVQVVGGTMDNGTMCQQDESKWQVSMEDIQRFGISKPVLGDFHRRHGGYVGALRQMRFSDENNPAGFEVWDSKTHEVEWVELDAAPKFFTEEVHHLAEAYGPGENEIYRVRYTGLATQEKIRSLEEAGAAVFCVVEQEERTHREAPDGTDLQDPESLIDLWANAQDPPLSLERLNEMKVAFQEVLQNGVEL